MLKKRKHSSWKNIYFISNDGDVTAYELDELGRHKQKFKKLEQRNKNEIYKDTLDIDADMTQDKSIHDNLNPINQNESSQQNSNENIDKNQKIQKDDENVFGNINDNYFISDDSDCQDYIWDPFF